MSVSKTIYPRERLLQLRTDGAPEAAPASPEARIFDVWLPCVAKASYSYYASNGSGERPSFLGRGSDHPSSGAAYSPPSHTAATVSPTTVSPPSGSSQQLYSVPSAPVAQQQQGAAVAAPSLWRYRSLGGTNVSNPMKFAEIAELAADELIDETTTEVARAEEGAGPLVFYPFLEVKADPEGYGRVAAVAAAAPIVAAPPAAPTSESHTAAPAAAAVAPGRYVPRKQASHTFPGPSVLHAASTAPPVPVTASGRFGPTAELLSTRAPTTLSSRPRVVPQVEWSRDDMLTSAELVETAAAAAVERTTPPPSRHSTSASTTPQHVSPALRPTAAPVEDTPPPPAWRAALAGLAAAGSPDAHAPSSQQLSAGGSGSPAGGITAEDLESGLLNKRGVAAAAPSSSSSPAPSAARPSQEPSASADNDDTTTKAAAGEEDQPTAAAAAAVSKSKKRRDSKKEKDSGKTVAPTNAAHIDPAILSAVPSSAPTQQQQQQRTTGRNRNSGVSPSQPATPQPTESSQNTSRSLTPVVEGGAAAASGKQTTTESSGSSSRRKRGGGKNAASSSPEPEPSPPQHEAAPQQAVSATTVPAAGTVAPSKQRGSNNNKARGSGGSAAVTATEAPAPPPTAAAAEAPLSTAATAEGEKPSSSGKSSSSKRGGGKAKTAAASTGGAASVPPATAAPPATASAEPTAAAEAHPPAKSSSSRRGKGGRQSPTPQDGAAPAGSSAWGAVAPKPVVDMQQVMHEAATSPTKTLYPTKPSGWRNVVGGGAAMVESSSLPTLDDVRSKKK